MTLSQLWCDFDKSSGFRNQTFNESAPIPDICFYPEVHPGADASICPASLSLASLHLFRPSGGGGSFLRLFYPRCS